MNKETIVGVDDGSGAIKVVFEQGQNVVKRSFRSAISSGLVLTDVAGSQVGGYVRGDAKFTCDEGSHWGGLSTHSDDYQASAQQNVLVANALIKSGLSGAISLVCGLPISGFYGAGSEALKEKKKVSMRTPVIPFGETASPFSIANVAVLPQGVGAFLSFYIRPDGVRNKEIDGARVCVVDIGSYTTDVAAVEASKFPTVDLNRSRGFSVGVNSVREKLRVFICRKCQVDEVTDKQIESALTSGKLSLFGKEIDTSPLVAAAVAGVWEGLLPQIRSICGDGAMFDHFLLVGGGATLFDSLAKQSWKHAVVLEEPIFANALGFFRYERFAQS